MWASEPSKWKQIKHNKVRAGRAGQAAGSAKALLQLQLQLLLLIQVSCSLFNLYASVWVCVRVCEPMSAVPTSCPPCLFAIMTLMVPRLWCLSLCLLHMYFPHPHPHPHPVPLPLPLWVSVRVARHCALHSQLAKLSHIKAMMMANVFGQLESPLNAFPISIHF